MTRLLTFFCSALVLLALTSCSDDGEAAAPQEIQNAEPEVDLEMSEAAMDEAAAQAREERINREFPLHGLVTGTQLTVREEADAESTIVGWLRAGSRVRVKQEPRRTATCSSGWYELMPRGFVCAGQGVEVGETAPEASELLGAANREEILPYTYYFVKEPMVPQYHQLPSRDAQRAARAFGDRYLEILDVNENRAARMLEGRLGGEPSMHPVVRRYLNHGFFVAGTGVEIRSRRRFVRTVDGAYVKQSRLEARTGSSFHGWELGDELQLPVQIARRDGRPLIRNQRADGSLRWTRDEEAEIIARHTVVSGYLRRERIGDQHMHVLEGDRYLRDWYISTVPPIEPPFSVEDDEPWVHVDLSQQSLVIYRGTTPVYVTLISSGLEEHATPTGTFEIKKKVVSGTMANLGAGNDDRYRIEDVPWTQYFEGSFALHTAFWHNRFGLQKSHGCVNLAPQDAYRVFRETWPRVPEGWHGVSTDRTDFRGSKVHVTE